MTHSATKFAGTAPQVLGSVAILLMVGPLVPTWAGLGLGVGVVAVLVVATGLCESTAARLLRGVHKATPKQGRLLAPVVTDLSASGNWPAGVSVRVLPAASGVDVGATGRDTLLITGGLLRALQGRTVSRQEAAALLAHGLGRLMASTTRSDLAIQAATLPVAVPLTAARFALGGLRALPLGAFAWTARGVTGVIAVAQAGQAGHWPIAVPLAVLVVLSYTTPRAVSAWTRMDQAAGDQGVIDAGLGPDLATMLHRMRVLTPQRQLHLDPRRPTCNWWLPGPIPRTADPEILADQTETPLPDLHAEGPGRHCPGAPERPGRPPRAKRSPGTCQESYRAGSGEPGTGPAGGPA